MAKNSGFPDSVQSGIPKLGVPPPGWARAPLSAYLNEVRRPAILEDYQRYTLVTVKRARGGVVEREKLLGKDIQVKTQFYVQQGDFLISKRQIVHGACGIVPPHLDGAVVSNEYAVLRSNDDLFLPFLKYYSGSIYFQQTCFHSSIGVHIEKMLFKLDHWLSWPFDLPPRSEQKRIFEILSTWDSALEVVDRSIRNANARKRGFLEALLSRAQRLGKFNGAWEQVILGDLGHFRKGKGISRAQLSAVGIPCVRYGEIYTDHHDFVRKFHSFIPTEVAEESERIFSGELLFAASGETAEEIGKCVAFLGNEEAYAGGDIVIFSPVAHDPMFLAYVLNSPSVVAQKSRFGQGKSVVHISAAALAAISFELPPLDEQKAIASFLSSLDEEEANLKQQAALLRREKSALMQQLLSGKRRANVEEMAA